MIALLIVHGIGEQRRGETTAKLITGFKAAYGDAVDVGLDGDGYPNAVTANGRTVRLYEVHWAEFLSRTANRAHSVGTRSTRSCGIRCGATDSVSFHRSSTPRHSSGGA